MYNLTDIAETHRKLEQEMNMTIWFLKWIMVNLLNANVLLVAFGNEHYSCTNKIRRTKLSNIMLRHTETQSNKREETR